MASTSDSLPDFTFGLACCCTGWLPDGVLPVDCVWGAAGASVVGGVGWPAGAGDCWPCGGACWGDCWVCAVTVAGTTIRLAASRVAIHWDAKGRFIGTSG